MFWLYEEVWRVLPVSWRFAISVASVAILGYSVSPISLASAFVFQIDQQQACQQNFGLELGRLNGYSNLNSLDVTKKSFSDCIQKIPSHPSLKDQYEARQQGRTILFSKEVK